MPLWHIPDVTVSRNSGCEWEWFLSPQERWQVVSSHTPPTLLKSRARWQCAAWSGATLLCGWVKACTWSVGTMMQHPGSRIFGQCSKKSLLEACEPIFSKSRPSRGPHHTSIRWMLGDMPGGWHVPVQDWQPQRKQCLHRDLCFLQTYLRCATLSSSVDLSLEVLCTAMREGNVECDKLRKTTLLSADEMLLALPHFPHWTLPGNNSLFFPDENSVDDMIDDMSLRAQASPWHVIESTGISMWRSWRHVCYYPNCIFHVLLWSMILFFYSHSHGEVGALIGKEPEITSLTLLAVLLLEVLWLSAV